jgi:site-specific DNA recombinase
MRCAIYARYSSDLQRETSIADQIRKCREYADCQGWSVLQEYVRFDEAVSGASISGRNALQTLIKEAKRRPLPFDRVLVDDTSRLARNIEDALRVTEILRFQGVYVTSVSQGIDSQQKSARQLLTLHGMMDEQFLVGLADKVHRGQEGRILKGLVAGGRCFGYRNVAIEDPTKISKYGRPAVVGVKLKIIEDEAAVVRRIFQMAADGLSLSAIAKTLNAERVQAPQPPRNRRIRGWCPSALHVMLRNERYRGVQIWNRTRKERNPETGRKISRRRPPSEWKRVEVAGWRIIPEELWQAVQSRIAEKKERFGNRSASGVRPHSKYLFSGLLMCGNCGSKMVIVSGGGKRGTRKYGCPSHRYRGTCPNAVTIRQDQLERQLLSFLEQHILTSEMVDYTIQLFEKELSLRLIEMQERSVQHSETVKRFEERQTGITEEIARLADAIAAVGHSPSLLARLAQAEK